MLVKNFFILMSVLDYSVELSSSVQTPSNQSRCNSHYYLLMPCKTNAVFLYGVSTWTFNSLIESLIDLIRLNPRNLLLLLKVFSKSSFTAKSHLL